MTNNKPLASELQRIFVQRAHFMLTEQVVHDETAGEIENENDMEIGERDDVTASDAYLGFKVSKNYRKEVDRGIRLGTFLYESGWLDDSLKVLNVTKSLINELDEDYTKLLLLLSCLQKLLHVQALFCCYKEASSTTTQTLNLIDKIQHLNSGLSDAFTVSCTNGVPDSFLANIYQELSVLHFTRSEYDLSYKWGVKALEYLRTNTPAKISVDVLRQAAKSCVVKRKFQIANLLINSAVRIAEDAFGDHHTVYADALLDKGFFLLNVDSINTSVEVYMVS